MAAQSSLMWVFYLLSIINFAAALAPSLHTSHRLGRFVRNESPTEITPFRYPRVARVRFKPLRFKVSDADEVLEEVDQSDIEFDDIDSSDLLRKLSKGLVPVAASVGFAVIPSSALAARLAGAAVGGAAGYFAQSALADRIQPHYGGGSDDGSGGGTGTGGRSNLSTAVLSCIRDIVAGPPLLSLSVQGIEAVARKNDVPPSQLGQVFTLVFAEIVLESIKQDSMDVTELSEVIDIAVDLGLSPAEIGDGFAIAGSKLGRSLSKDSRGFFLTESLQDLLQQSAKMFFLADKMIGSSDGFYGKRLQVALCFFSQDEFREVITDACKQLFRKCIESVLGNPNNFSKEEVDQLKDFLGAAPEVSSLRPATMQNMIMEAIQLQLENTMAQPAMEANIGDYDKYLKAQEVLGWNERELKSTVETRTMPVFEKAAEQLIEQVVEKHERAAELAEVLEERISSLGVDRRKARVYVTKLISTKNGEYMNQIDKVYAASGGAVDQAFKLMVSYAQTHDAFKTLTASLMQDTSLPLPGLPFADMVRVSMYELQIVKGGDASGVKSDMFDLSPAQQQLVRKNLALPKVTAWIKQCISESNFADGAKTAYKKLLEEYGVDEKQWRATSIDFYYQETSRVANARQVPTSEDMQRLTDLKNFLDCPEQSVAKANLELLGDKYVKALSESMAPTGVIAEEYLDGLDRLRERLGLTVEDAQSLLSFAARGRIRPIVTDLVDMWKSDTDADYRRKKERDEAQNAEKKRMGKKDKSGDPISSLDNVLGYMETGAQKEGGGPNVFMREALNLVDFVVENFNMQGVDVQNAERAPVTATGIVSEKDLVGMYKHYVITRLAEQDPQLRARYLAIEPLFAKILGITEASQMKAKESLAYRVYKNMLKNVMLYKEVAEPQDLQQFVILKENLELEQEVADKVMDEATRDAVVEHAATLFRPTNARVTAQTARRFRNQIQSLGLEIQKDTCFNERLITYLYALEVQDLVESGLEGDLQEVQEAYDIPEERAAEIVEVSCARYISQMLNFALRAAKKYNEVECVRWMKEIAKYAEFVPETEVVDADGNLFTNVDKKRMLAFYRAEIESQFNAGGKDEDAEGLAAGLAMVDKLKAIINVSDEYVAPIQGIEGLLGNVNSVADMERDAGSGVEGKKNWAWG